MLTDKVVWVTGASRGIGRAIAVSCAQQGARTVLVARHQDHLAETVAAIHEVGGVTPILLDYDITSLSDVGAAFNRVYKETRRVDVLVNNAGVMQDALLGMISSTQVEETFATNVFAVLYHMQYAARLMARQKAGSIINVSSIIGRHGNVGQTVYGASKAAVIGATQSAAKELAPQNIRVNAIAPGFIETDMVRQLSQDKFDLRLAAVGMGRIGSVDDVARVALFLASDMSSYVTGQVLGVDGAMLV
ncbi:MAG: SDR family oxidoreductase [Rhodocyclaceae bacterium]|nr:MAG: SDR family oxidoreductase [Rhodocyclaceae bacterium]